MRRLLQRCLEALGRLIERWRRAARRAAPPPGAPRTLDELVEAWLVTREADLHERTVRMHRHHGRVLGERLPPLAELDEAALERFWDLRLEEVKRSTLLKELSTLRQALDWARARGWVQDPPPVRIPSRQRGGTTRRRHHRNWLSPRQIEAVLAELPERTPSGARPRDWYTLLWETGLRRGTLARLRGRDWDRRRATLHVPPEADKARFGRPLPVTPRAARLLGRLAAEAGEQGLLFATSPNRHVLQSAARRAGLPGALCAGLTDHDLRRSRATDWLERSGDLSGVAYLLGHLRPSTTDRYARPRLRAAARVLGGRLGAVDIGAASG